MGKPLSDTAIADALTTLSGWSRRGDAITKTYQFPTFDAGIAFVTRLARAADAMNHHPDIDIRYTRVTLALSTHDAGGITNADVELARQAERAAAER